MVVMIFERVPPKLQGELTRWLLEVKTGVYIGSISAMVRDQLWEKSLRIGSEGGIFQAWKTNNEQGFAMRMEGIKGRTINDFDGLKLITIC